MLLTEYHPGHPSTENKFKIHMVNLSPVNLGAGPYIVTLFT